MKIWSMKLLVVGIFACSLALAQEPISFRNLSLGGVVSDKLDLIYDPIQLRFVDSLMLYTNLSNLTTTNEQIFANSSDNEYLIGISDKDPYLKNHWISALVRVRDSKLPSAVHLSTALNSTDDMYGEGSLTSDYSSYYDNTGDGLYDYRRQIVQEVNAYRTSSGSSFVVNNTFLIDGYTVGVKLGLISSTLESNFAPVSMGTGNGKLAEVYSGMSSFKRNYLETDLKTNQPSLAWSEAGDFLMKDDERRKRIDASIMMPLGRFELRGDLCAYTIYENTSAFGTYAGSQNDYPLMANAVDRYQEAENWQMKQLRDGSAYGIGAGLRYLFKESNDRTMQGFVDVNAGVIGESYDFTSGTTNNFKSLDEKNLVVDGNFSNDTRWDEQDTYAGPGTTSIYYLNGRANIPLRNGIYVGLGMFFSSSVQDINAKFHYSYVRTIQHTTIDAVTNSFDYTETITDFVEADERIEQSLTDIRLPVGLEYRFTESKAWALRFGAVFEYNAADDNVIHQITGSEPGILTWTDGSGRKSMTSTDNTYLSTSRHTTMKTSRTYYTHGLGYNPTDNLQIDLLGFLSADDAVTFFQYLKSLRLSFVLQI